MKQLLIPFFLIIAIFGNAQDIFYLEEYLAFLKKYHPTVKQANLVLNEAEAKLLKARGGFDPKIEVDYDKKEFKGSNYFDKLNAAFKIPTWYGIEVKGSFENNSGVFLNPEFTVPDNGLYNLGVSVSLARNLLINDRMAAVQKAKLYNQRAVAENQLLVNQILYDAVLAYFNWLRTYREKMVYEEFLKNARLRFDGVKRSYEEGDKPAIDTTEARIALNTRRLNLEKANLNYIKSTLELSNFLWINDVPVEVTDELAPDLRTRLVVDEELGLTSLFDSFSLDNHPKLQSLDLKFKELEVERRLRRNNLLPQIDLQYNFLSENVFATNDFQLDNYKAGIRFSFPLFLRKERADLKLTDYKLQAVDFEKESVKINLKNKIGSAQNEIVSYQSQSEITEIMISDYERLLSGEERKFQIGESSLFLINSRESKLIESKLKAIDLENLYLNSKAKLFNAIGVLD